MNIYLATDHAGFALKESLKQWLIENGHTVKDFGATRLDPEDDYPDFVVPLASALQNESDTFGILFGRTGQGEAICANRFRSIRAIVYNHHDLGMIRLGREHNDANVLSIGADTISLADAQEAITAFLATPFTREERHVRRIGKLNEPALYTYGAEE